MADLLSPHQVTIYPPPPSARSRNMHMMYYGLVVIGAASVVLALYNLIIIRWCGNFTTNGPRQRTGNGPRSARRSKFHDAGSLNSISSFKYKKEGVGGDEGDEYNQCAVCLSVLEEGEEVKQLPKCKHSFHAPCIDMWLYSHLDCPLCRTPVEPQPVLQQHTVTETSGHSCEVLLGQGAALV